MFSDTSQSINKEAKRKLNQERKKLILITALRLPSQIVTKMLYKRNKQIKHYIALMIGLPLYIFSRLIDNYWKSKAREEWDAKKNKRNGSEMCLYFKREA